MDFLRPQNTAAYPGFHNAECRDPQVRPSYEYDQSDEATIKCGDALLGTKARCEREFKLDMTKETRCNESFYMDVTIKALKQALDSEQSIGIQIGTHPRTILSSTCRAKIKKFIEILQSGSYPEGTLNEETDKPKAPEFSKPLAVPPKQKVKTLTVDLLDTTWEVSGTGDYIYIYGEVRDTSGVTIKALKMTALWRPREARWCPQKMPTPPHASLSRVTSPRLKSWHTRTPASIITISSSSPLARTSNTVRPGHHRCKEFACHRPTIGRTLGAALTIATMPALIASGRRPPATTASLISPVS